jgi:hypothetical protein
MKGTRTKTTVALLLALILVMTLAVMPAHAGNNKIVVHKFIRADFGGFLRGGGITLVVPPNSLPRNMMITMQVNLDDQEVRFTPDMDFDRPVLVYFAFDVNGMNYWDHGKWVPVPMLGRAVILHHFSRYAWW